jgi:hypothetical protein
VHRTNVGAKARCGGEQRTKVFQGVQLVAYPSREKGTRLREQDGDVSVCVCV